ncbi:MAG: YeeE/YedE family protein [Chloroflexi bacterium]|nr:YeeE/YedE family protein [Chloroflexota bacterium]
MSAPRGVARFVLVGAYLGLVLTKAEVVSWYRIQEMFRFEAFHMYGVIGAAVATAAVSILLIRRFGIRTIDGDDVEIATKEPLWRRGLFGGTLFGLGWALTGACPGPIAALIGAGSTGYLVVLVGAVIGTMLYGGTRHRLPH